MTGGTADLPGMEDLARRVFHSPVRIGRPPWVPGPSRQPEATRICRQRRRTALGASNIKVTGDQDQEPSLPEITAVDLWAGCFT